LNVEAAAKRLECSSTSKRKNVRYYLSPPLLGRADVVIE
jgi:hypothetical protein